jgi:hypothetical protein
LILAKQWDEKKLTRLSLPYKAQMMIKSEEEAFQLLDYKN